MPAVDRGEPPGALATRTGAATPTWRFRLRSGLVGPTESRAERHRHARRCRSVVLHVEDGTAPPTDAFAQVPTRPVVGQFATGIRMAVPGQSVATSPADQLDEYSRQVMAVPLMTMHEPVPPPDPPPPPFPPAPSAVSPRPPLPPAPEPPLRLRAREGGNWST